MGIMVLFLLIGDTLLIFKQRELCLEEAKAHTKNELELVGTSTLEYLLKHDYASVEQFIMKWGEDHASIIELKAIAPNKFLIAEYKSKAHTRSSFQARHQVEFFGRNLVTLVMVKDFAPVEKAINIIRFKLITGSIIFIVFLGYFLWNTLNKTAMVPLKKEIAERIQTEEALRSSYEFTRIILDSMGDAISIIDVETFKIVTANKVYLEKHGLNEDEAKWRCCYDITHHYSQPCETQGVNCPITETVTTGKQAFVEHVHQNKNGENDYFEVSTFPIKDKNGKILQVVHVQHNITERKKAERKLKAFSEKLQQSNKELQDFVHIASHDLQEPLRKVTAFGDRLKEKYSGSLGEKGLDYLERMQSAAVRMQGLINGLLIFSRVTTIAQSFVPVDLSAIAKEVLSDLEVLVEQVKGQVVIGSLATIDADPLQMRQLLQNLIGNALKFNREGETPVVKVNGSLINGNNPGERGEDFYRLTVEDNGIGFKEEYAERIFGVFQRLHGRNEYEGTGIGLSVCKKIAERHGGSIIAKSSPGQGTKFIITLPVRQHLEAESV